MAEDPPDLLVVDAAAWRGWLAGHADDQRGVFLLLAKKGGAASTTLTYDEALEEALCHGWIDGQARRGDDATYRVRFTPRRRRSLWSQRNVEIVARLTADGRMLPGGLAEVEHARADGRWEAAYAGAATLEVPDDLAAALRASPVAQAAFDRLDRQNRYAVLHRVVTAVRPQTRAQRITRHVAMLERGETPYPQQGSIRG